MTKRELERLKRVKEAKGLTYSQLAKAAKCTPAYAAQLLQGHKDIPTYKRVIWDRIVKAIVEAP